MEASSLIMGGSSSSSSYLKLFSCKHNDTGFVHHFNGRRRRNYNSEDVGFKLSISSSSSIRTSIVCRPVSCSSSHTDNQTELENHKLLIEESPNGGHTIEAAETVRVKFQLHRECSFGHNFLITGDDRVLGLWDPNNAVPLTWSEGHLWSADLDIPIGKCIKFKFILMQESDGVIVWQPGPDRVLECFKTDKMMTLCEDWEDPDLRKIIEIEPQETQMIEPTGDQTLIEPLVNGTEEEPKVYATNMKQVLVSDHEGVPVLVPGLNEYQEHSVNEEASSNDEEPESLINGSAMVSTDEPDMAKDLILLPDECELDLKGGDAHNTSNLNPRTVRENQESSDQNGHQQVTDQEKREHWLLNWGYNAVEKLLSIFGIQ